MIGFIAGYAVLALYVAYRVYNGGKKRIVVTMGKPPNVTGPFIIKTPSATKIPKIESIATKGPINGDFIN